MSGIFHALQRLEDQTKSTKKIEKEECFPIFRIRFKVDLAVRIAEEKTEMVEERRCGLNMEHFP